MSQGRERERLPEDIHPCERGRRGREDGEDESSEDDEMACEIHEIEQLPSGYDHCPICREERRIRELEIHKMTRDPTLEPW